MFLVMLKSPFSCFFAETCWGVASFFPSAPTLHPPEAVRMFWRAQGIF